MDPATFLTELKRRKVYRVAVAYAIVAWLLIQAASILFPTFEAPPWVMKVFVTAVILGFPERRIGVACSDDFDVDFVASTAAHRQHFALLGIVDAIRDSRIAISANKL